MKTQDTLGVGSKCVVFDGSEWYRTGDIGDNSCYWKQAEIVAIYTEDEEVLCDVRWAETGRISKGHFLSAVRV